MKTTKNHYYFEQYCFGILIAIELLMSFTSLGYIHIPPISITIAYLPILVAGCLFGPIQSLIIACIFGMASMYKASAYYSMPTDAVFSPLLSGSPISSIILSIGARMLFGFVIGLAFLFVKKRKHYRIWIGVLSAIAPKVHSLIVYTTMGILFPRLGYNYYSVFRWRLRDTIFAIICVITVELLWAFYQSDTIQNIKSYINQSSHNPYASRKMNWIFVGFEFFLLCMAFFAAIYFSDREYYMLKWHGIAVSHKISADLLLLQIQFLMSLFALNIISVIFLISLYKYMSYKEYKGELDELTGIMGRRMFLYHCEKAQKAKSTESKRMGWFLFVDVDYFKAINDTFGHAVGDKVLKEIATNLQNTLGNDGEVGRIGGDEFAAIIEKPLSEQELKQHLQQFLDVISGILSEKKVSCSIGAYQFIFPQDVKCLLTETDEVLYKAKENGRACYVLKTCIDEKQNNCVE
ncbi:ECF transporter S component [Lachnospiraceae bacterium 46-61]